MHVNKSSLRSLVRIRKSEHASEYPHLSRQLCRQVLALPRWRDAGIVLLYHALPDEPDLQTLLEDALLCGKQVLMPVVVKDDLLLRRYKGPGFLREGAFHILEPTGPEFPPSRYHEISLALVPGVAFDVEGHRLGRGRGYYDRFLPRLTHAYKLGICFPFQIFPSIPHEFHDIAMDEVVSSFEPAQMQHFTPIPSD